MEAYWIIGAIVVSIIVLFIATSGGIFQEHMVVPETILIRPRHVPLVAPRFPELTVTSPASAPVLRRANPRP